VQIGLCDKSRMTGDCHVRFRERLGVRFPRPTRPGVLFSQLRLSVGWGIPNRKAIATGLNNTIYSLCSERKNEIIGYGRIVGDGGFTVFIQDVIVKPPYQKQGIGTAIMTKLMEYINGNYTTGTYIGLMATKGREAFYKKFGFIERPNEQFGAGMIQFIK
jgi:ribosomal protein S18 acetylase RimI-like enzyme